MEEDNKNLSLVRFFNSYDLSDCTLEIIEVDTETYEKHGSYDTKRLKYEESGHQNSSVNNKIKSEELPCRRKRKLEDCQILKNREDMRKTSDDSKTILFIHSLLFCSNSEFFQNVLMNGSRQQNMKVLLKHGETDHFVQLMKLFYDDGLIAKLSLLDTSYVLKFAKRFKCISLTTKLLHHISSCMITSTCLLNETMSVYYDLLNTDNKNMDDILFELKQSCSKYLKKLFCPLEKVFGPLLNDFLNLSYQSLLFFLQCIENGLAVSENTAVSMVLYWMKHTSGSTDLNLSSAIKLLSNCRFEHVSIYYIMDVLWSHQEFHQFYTEILEQHVCTGIMTYYPDFPQRGNRNRNYAYDHEVILYFHPEETVNLKLEQKQNQLVQRMFTSEQNVIFVQGYQLSFSSGTFMSDDKKELKVELTVQNVKRRPHSQLLFSMLYAIASPSVSEKFSPWNHCIFVVDSSQLSSWGVISLIADHSLINKTGFYLKFYME